MTTVDGRNPAMSWVGGLLAVGVIGALVWFATPVLPILGEFIGDALRTIAP